MTEKFNKGRQKRDLNKDPQEKLELAKRIANNSKRISHSYASFETKITAALHWLSGLLDKFLFGPKLMKIAALLITILIYTSITLGSDSSVSVTQASQLSNIPVKVTYNSEIYEISGLPETVNVIVMGDMSDITLQKSQNTSSVVVDLSGLTEGTYSVKLEPSNFISRLKVTVEDYPTATVTIKKKVTEHFNISYEFINTNKMDAIYTLSTPVFDSTQVLIRASQDTIDSIAFVKALIDVSGVTTDFTTAATLAAYDQMGNLVKCDIIPSTVNATVGVSSPHKDVSITVVPSGTMQNGLAIDSITLDHTAVTIYAAESILETINEVTINLDVSAITGDTTLSTALSLPSGVKSMSVTKVNMEIKVGPAVSKTISNVPTLWRNNNNEYRFAVVNTADAYMNVTVTGTAANIEKITSSDITVYIDIANVTVGVQSVPLYVSGSNNYVTYAIADGRTSVEIQVVNK